VVAQAGEDVANATIAMSKDKHGVAINRHLEFIDTIVVLKVVEYAYFRIDVSVWLTYGEFPLL
jgi:hypothetical protein